MRFPSSVAMSSCLPEVHAAVWFNPYPTIKHVFFLLVETFSVWVGRRLYLSFFLLDILLLCLAVSCEFDSNQAICKFTGGTDEVWGTPPAGEASWCSLSHTD